MLKAIFVDEPGARAFDPAALTPIKLDFLQKFSVAALAGVILFLGLWPATLVAQIIAVLP